MTTDRRYSNVLNVFKGIADTGVVCETRIVVVNSADPCGVGEVFSIFNEGSKLNCIKDIGFLFATQAVALCVATTFNVEYILISPNVFIVSDKRTLRVAGESSFTSARKSKKNSGITIDANVSGAVHAEGFLLWHIVMHYAEDSLFHLTCIGSAKDNLFFGAEVDIYRGLALYLFNVFVSYKFSSVKNGEVRAVCFEILFNEVILSADKHLFHEKSVVRAT